MPSHKQLGPVDLIVKAESEIVARREINHLD